MRLSGEFVSLKPTINATFALIATLTMAGVFNYFKIFPSFSK